MGPSDNNPVGQLFSWVGSSQCYVAKCLTADDEICTMYQWAAQDHVRLLNSPSLLAMGLSQGCKFWPPISWHQPFVIACAKFKLGDVSVVMHSGFMWGVGISTLFETPLPVPLHSPNGRHLPAIRACARRLWKSLIRDQYTRFTYPGAPSGLSWTSMEVMIIVQGVICFLT